MKKNRKVYFNLILVLPLVLFFFSCNPGKSTSSINGDSLKVADSRIVQPDTSFLWGDKYKRLQLGIRMVNDSLEIRIKNYSDTLIKACSHINTQDLDWYSIELINSQGESRLIHVGEPGRTGSEMHTFELGSQKYFSHKVSLNYWATHGIIGGKPLLPGEYKVSVTYETHNCYYPAKGYWNGKIHAGTINYSII